MSRTTFSFSPLAGLKMYSSASLQPSLYRPRSRSVVAMIRGSWGQLDDISPTQIVTTPGCLAFPKLLVVDHARFGPDLRRKGGVGDGLVDGVALAAHPGREQGRVLAAPS